MPEDIRKIYENRKNMFTKDLQEEKRKSDNIVLIRTIISLVVISLIIYGLIIKNYNYIYYTLPLIILFIGSVLMHHKVKSRISYLLSIINFNEESILRLAGKWTDFPKNGSNYLDPEHPYSTDLNIFGKGSLFQYLNETTTLLGEGTLVKVLKEQPKLDEIKLRQQAVTDLKNRLAWRQHFRVVGKGVGNKIQNPEKLLNWADGDIKSTPKSYVPFLWIIPVITLGLIISTVLGITPLYPLLIALIIQLFVYILNFKVIQLAFKNTEYAVDELEIYSNMLNCIEEQKFNATMLVDLQQMLRSSYGSSAGQIKSLAKIAGRISFMYSPLIHYILNVTVFWDLHTLLKLEKWKANSGLHLRKWFKVIGQFEVLSSLASVAHDNPQWTFPNLEDSSPSFEAVGLGHPLIHENNRISNDISLAKTGTVLLITGSNMSGKSTFLRTIGINLVLAYSGAPVCAANLRCSLMGIYSSMQIHDNLEQKISTFYAELKRVKMIVDVAMTRQPIIFLLDEIFKGTNSKDRIFAAKTLIKKLSTTLSIGLVTTHDLELGVLERESPLVIKNYHFTDKIIDNQIQFDYKIKNGISQTTNAIALMKMIGIDLED